MNRNDGFVGQIPFPPKSIVVDTEVRQKRMESLEAFLVEVSMSDLEERNKSLLQGFLGVTTSGITAVVCRFKLGDEGKKYVFEIKITDRNGKDGAIEKRYSEFDAFRRKIGALIKGMVLASFPGKLLSNSTSALRERRQSLGEERWGGRTSGGRVKRERRQRLHATCGGNLRSTYDPPTTHLACY
jgi:hypothetical protein